MLSCSYIAGGCISVMFHPSTAPLWRRVGSLAVPKAFWSWMVLVGSVVAPWFPGACMSLTMWRSLIVQHVTTTIKMKQAALSSSVSMTVQFLPRNWNNLIKKSPAKKKIYILNERHGPNQLWSIFASKQSFANLFRKCLSDHCDWYYLLNDHHRKADIDQICHERSSIDVQLGQYISDWIINILKNQPNFSVLICYLID